MSDHLPECAIVDKKGYPFGGPCFCPALRACEQRVRDEGDPFREAYRAGYSKGVRDAHKSASWCQDPDEMLEAIIGLLNMPPPPPLPPSVGVPEKWRP